MIDRNVIREEYRKMSDEALISFVINEAEKLTLEAFYILKEEYENRNLNEEIINEAAISRSLIDYNKYRANETITAIDIYETIWKYAFSQKEAGRSNSSIFNGLVKKKVNPDYAYFVIAELEDRAKELIENCEDSIIVSYLIIAAGMVLFLLAGSEVLPKTLLFYAIAFILSGIIALYIITTRKKKHKKILENISAEKEERDQTVEYND